MPKPKPISGFPEWSPAQSLAEQTFLRTIAAVYESYGYTPLDTPAVERIEVLTAKGVVDKEIYALERLREESRQNTGSAELGLRFDHTIPFARYVAQHYGALSFPFKRYQIGKVWRGERPQEGRFREFYQADIDVIAEESLPLTFDAEMPRIIFEVFQRMGLRAQIRINNRKLLLGLYQELNISTDLLPAVLREADKLEKIGPEELSRQLSNLGLSPETCQACLKIASTHGTSHDVLQSITSLGLSTPAPGWKELKAVEDSLTDLPKSSIRLDLGIVRGLDYYTGTIYETFLTDYPELGSVCSGGRYEDLVSGFINKKLPGVGISIGVSRLISHLFKTNGLPAERHCPTQILIVLPEESSIENCQLIAKQLRSHGFNIEVYHQAQKLQKQIRYADRKGIPLVLFPHSYQQNSPLVEIKNLASGEQVEVLLPVWISEHKSITKKI